MPVPGRPRPPARRLKRLVVVDVAVRLVFSAVMVGSIYLLFAGHNQPGGGFVGGIVAGAAVALRYVAGGIDDVRSLSRAHPWTVLGAGLLLSVTTALVPVLLGGAPLESAVSRPTCRCSATSRSPRRCPSTSACTWWCWAWCSWCSSRSATTPSGDGTDRVDEDDELAAAHADQAAGRTGPAVEVPAP